MSSQRGFTLVELAIVITVIGLVVGGILLGRDVLLNSQLQSVISDVNRYKKAAQLFKDKYYYLPGDLPNATVMWGAESLCTGTPPDGNEPHPQTCNGNGDGFIGGVGSSGLHPSPVMWGEYYKEATRAWQHLANGGFIEAQYNGSAKLYTAGKTVPKSKLGDGVGYIMFYSSPVDSSSQTPDGVTQTGAMPGQYGHIIEIASSNSIQYGITRSFNVPAMSAANAKSIDTKIDDGKPNLGNVMSFANNDPSSGRCVTASNDEYNTLNYQTEIVCALIFVTGF